VIDKKTTFSLSSLGSFTAEVRRSLFAELSAGLSPTSGTFDSDLLKIAQTKGAPQMGSYHYEPVALIAEFIYPDASSGTVIFSVKVPTPERIVYLPIPEWIIESIWQGEISGSYQFESHAISMVESFKQALTPEMNAQLFNAEIRTVKG
jgi:hypothetical protein